MPKADSEFPPPPWYQAVMWSGADFRGLVRILNSNRWRVSPSHWPGCCIDLMFAVGNSGLGAVQSLLYGNRLRRLEIQEDPVFIIGHWRTGTTLLHELLALDSQNTCPTNYQCFVPSHFLLTESLLKPWTNFALPANRPPDQMQLAWDSPQEDEFALCNLGVPSPYATIAFPNRPPAFMEFLTLESVTSRQREHWKRSWMTFLKGLYFRKPGRLVLKSPSHTSRLPLLLEMFPNARFINLVRHPTTVFLSTVRLWKSLFATHGYQIPRFEGLEEFVYATFLQMHEQLEATRDLVPPGRLIDIRYEDLAGDMIGTTQTIYESLELGDFDQVRPRIEEYVLAHRNYEPNRHQANSELESEVYSRWRPYFDRYGYSGTLPLRS
ncbi:MAG TPA: sulfotransferase [Pirellulaceae bacterium]|nr:sulfotransferase [Planctomycetales bacterium]MCB9941617.1 sulfotransferase [Planctomycetaceae bacterium]HRX82880.1 sulfotransferase [Pirellulaceae bacterium]